MENKKKDIPISEQLNDEQLEQVSGGAINVFCPTTTTYCVFRCRVCKTEISKPGLANHTITLDDCRQCNKNDWAFVGTYSM